MAIPLLICGALCVPRQDCPAAAHDWVLRYEESAEHRYLEGLRRRQLFTLATSYCRRQLARPDLSDEARAEFVSELMQSLAAQASHSTPDQRAALWQRAHNTAAEFAQKYPDHAFGLIVRLQDALTWLAEGEMARYESSRAGGPPADRLETDRLDAGERDRPRRALRRAIRELEQVRDRIELVAGRGLGGTRTSPAPWTKTQLASLANHCAYQLARALRNQGLCYPADSPDRINSMTRAMESLSSLVNRQPSDTLAARGLIERAECLRWLGKLDRAGEVLGALDPAQMSPPVAAQWEAERIHLMLAAGQIAEAVARATARESEGQAHGEWEIARLEAILAAWREAASSGNQDVARRRIDQATASVRRIEQQLGPYWTWRGQRLLAGLAASPQTQNDTQALLRAAEGLLHGGDQDDAVRVYDRIATLARQQDDADRARQAAFAAATIRRRQSKHDDAAARYRKVALEDPRWPQAAEAHLLSVFHSAQHARHATADTRDDAVSRYEELLREHLDHWPDAPTAHRARVWLGDLRRGQNRWSEALDLYREIPVGSAVYDDALTGIGRVYDQWLLAGGEPVPRAELRQALDDLRQLLLGKPQRWPTQWTPGKRVVALTIARLLLDSQSAAQQAAAVLQHALAGPPPAERPWADRARVLLAVAEALEGNVSEARTLFEDTRGTAAAETLLDAVRLIIDNDRGRDAGARKARAELALEELEQLAAGNNRLPDAHRARLLQLRARAWRQAGDRQQALQAFATLASQRPDDASLQEAYAEMLSTSNDPATLTKALARWVTIQRMCRVGSDRWFRARYGQARVYFRLGDRDKCGRLIELTRVLMPALGGPDMQAQFMELAARCQSEIGDSGKSNRRDEKP